MNLQLLIEQYIEFQRTLTSVFGYADCTNAGTALLAAMEAHIHWN